MLQTWKKLHFYKALYKLSLPVTEDQLKGGLNDNTGEKMHIWFHSHNFTSAAWNLSHFRSYDCPQPVLVICIYISQYIRSIRPNIYISHIYMTWSYFVVKIVKYCETFQAYKNNFQHLELIKYGNVIPKTLIWFSLTVHIQIKTKRSLGKDMAVSYEKPQTSLFILSIHSTVY